ncbi:hypothetical protein D3C79_779670 [compost metagenome]
MPDEIFLGRFRTNVASLGPQIPMGQLEPSTCKRFGEVIGILVETFGDLTIFGIHLHGHIGIGHDWVQANIRVFNINWLVFLFDINGFPLPCPGWTFLEFPFVVQQ